MKFLIILCCIPLMLNATELKISEEQSSVKFGIQKFKIGKIITGKFEKFSGSIEYVEGNITKVQGDIAVSSLNTEEEKRDVHLKSKDFFDVKTYPKMSFVSTSPLIPGKRGYILRGKLTIKDVTKDVTWTVESISEKEHSVSFTIKEKIDRYQYNIQWNKRMDTQEEESWVDRVANATKGLIGKYVLDKDVEVELKLVALKK